MKKVTKEWLWLMIAMIASLLCVAILRAGGVQPLQSLPFAIYVIMLPVAGVYLIRTILWAVKQVGEKTSEKSS